MLCVDEKSQIQALDRTAPVLPHSRARYAFDWKEQFRLALARAVGDLLGATKTLLVAATSDIDHTALLPRQARARASERPR